MILYQNSGTCFSVYLFLYYVCDRGPEEKKMLKYKYAEIIIQNLKLHVL